jgi:hypothetical protein
MTPVMYVPQGIPRDISPSKISRSSRFVEVREGQTLPSLLPDGREGVMDLSLIDFGSRVESLCCVCHSRKHELLPALRSSSMPTFEKACLDYP